MMGLGFSVCALLPFVFRGFSRELKHFLSLTSSPFLPDGLLDSCLEGVVAAEVHESAR